MKDRKVNMNLKKENNKSVDKQLDYLTKKLDSIEEQLDSPTSITIFLFGCFVLFTYLYRIVIGCAIILILSIPILHIYMRGGSLWTLLLYIPLILFLIYWLGNKTYNKY